MKRQITFLLIALILAVGLYCFYLKYVPLVKPFQTALLPVLLFAFVLTTVKVRTGTLFFIFSFPLINSLPYLFRIFENIPHAPTSLVLFLFYLLGWLAHHVLYPSKPFPRLSVFRPMTLFSLMILISAIITLLRYANFFPFLSDHVYELATNVHGVTAGGAMMSVIFLSLNYLTGFAFFFILLNTIETREDIKRILVVLLISTSIALMVGSYQHLHDQSFGNTPMRINESLINATFKNPLSFGAYLSILLPLILAAAMAFKGTLRLFSFLLFFWGLLILPQTGSKSGLATVFLSLLLFWILALSKAAVWRRLKSLSSKKVLVSVIIFILVAAALLLFLISFKDSEAYKRLTQREYPYGGLEEAIRIRWHSQWRMAVLMMKHYPLSGVGVGAYIIELPNYALMYQSPYKTWTDSAENYFLHVGSELGIVALVFSLWIFWEIFNQMRKVLGESFPRSRWRYIPIGLSCGILSLFLQFFAHTYIGSFEVKYTFWLLVSLIFSFQWVKKDEMKGGLFSKKAMIAASLLLAFSLGIHLWNSTHSLSLKRRTEQFQIQQNFGLYKKEITRDGREFRWTKRFAGLTIKIEKPVMEITLHASHPDIERNPVKVKILLIEDFFKKKKVLDQVILKEGGWNTFVYHIQEEVNREVLLLIQVSRTWNPFKSRGVPDSRDLGVALGKIQFKRATK